MLRLLVRVKASQIETRSGSDGFNVSIEYDILIDLLIRMTRVGPARPILLFYSRFVV